jgi:hypothetical protein
MAQQRKSFKTAIDKTNLSERGGIKSLVGNPAPTKPEPQPIHEESEPAKDIRQTFVIREDYLEKLKDFVHLKRVTEDSYYTQKEAMQEALDMLFESVDEIPGRPEKIKEREQERASRIRRGKRN